RPRVGDRRGPQDTSAGGHRPLLDLCLADPRRPSSRDLAGTGRCRLHVPLPALEKRPSTWNGAYRWGIDGRRAGGRGSATPAPRCGPVIRTHGLFVGFVALLLAGTGRPHSVVVAGHLRESTLNRAAGRPRVHRL